MSNPDAISASDFEQCGMDLSATMTPPFHRPISEEEMRKYLIKPGSPLPEDGEMEIGEGWVLSAFSIATKHWREAAWGWVKCAFAVDERRAGDVYFAVLNHLQTGYAMINAYSGEDAAIIGDLLAPLCDWAATDVARCNMQVLNVRNTLKAAGYERVDVISDDLQKLKLYMRARAQ